MYSTILFSHNHSKMSEYLILVDKNDNPLGQQEKLKAHQLAQCHRAFSVFIYRFNTENQKEILLQQRHRSKYHCGGLWTNTCCGHPRPGEATDDAASRRLFEEMGIQSQLKAMGVFHYIATFDNGLTENEVDHIFIGTMKNSTLEPHAEEVSNYRWVSLLALKQEMQENGTAFTPWLPQALDIAFDEACYQHKK